MKNMGKGVIRMDAVERRRKTEAKWMDSANVDLRE